MSHYETDRRSSELQAYNALLKRISRVRVFFRDAGWALSRLRIEITNAGVWPIIGRIEGVPTWREVTDELSEIQQAIQNLETEAAKRHEQIRRNAIAHLNLSEFYQGDSWSPLDVEEAISDFAYTDDDDADSGSTPEERLNQYRDAGRALERACRKLLIERAVEQARSAKMPERGPEPESLVDGNSDGGRRHYLRGEPVYCGTELHMLTRWGWLPGRYEMASDGDPVFYFALVPGDDRQLSILIDGSMRFAWSHEFRR